MKQAVKRLEVSTRGQGLYEIRDRVVGWVSETGCKTGLSTLFIQHTSAPLTIQENAEPDVIADLNDHFKRLAPEDNKLCRHPIEGPDDMPAHVRAALTDTGLSIPIVDGRPTLGISSSRPLQNVGVSDVVEVDGRPEPPAESLHDTFHQTISPDYFRAMGIRLEEGRFFEPADREQTEPVAIVNEALARKYFANEGPVGRHFVLSRTVTPWSRG